MRELTVFKDFQCIAGDCRDSCCIGWELDIDEETYGRYQRTEGPFGDRLRAHMEDIEEDGEVFHTFRREGPRCPFLNDRDLCDIILTLGEDALCTVCTEYPRYTVRLGETLERTLTLSCEEAGRLFFGSEEKLCFIEEEDNLPEECDTDEEDDFAPLIYKVRERAIALLQDRTRPINERINRYLAYMHLVQEALNREEADEESLALSVDELSFENHGGRDSFAERLEILGCLEVLNDEWQGVYDALCACEEEYESLIAAFAADPAAASESELAFEHLMVYFTLRYFPQAADDGDLITKARFALFCLDVIRDMDALRFKLKQDPDESCAGDEDLAARRIFPQIEAGPWSTADRIDNVRIFCKEVEHSDDNVAVVMEELLFSELN